jgi:hypothetical protein
MTSSPERYVPGCLVRYRPPTDTRGGRWLAVIKRGNQPGDRFAASVPFHDGPDAAAAAAVAKFNQCMPGVVKREGAGWIVLGAALSLDGGDSYAYPVGPSYRSLT